MILNLLNMGLMLKKLIFNLSLYSNILLHNIESIRRIFNHFKNLNDRIN